MQTLNISEIRKDTKESAPFVDFDGIYTFYYDETNNIRKFYVKEKGFNSNFTNNFVLGGLVHEGSVPDVQPLIDSLNLQKTVKEIKFKHIAKGDFIDCLKSQKLNQFLKYFADGNLYIHYSNINLLYWSIVDIVDSAIANSVESQLLGREFADKLKNDLYKLFKMEIDSVVSLFHKYRYPNIKKEELFLFIDEIIEVFSDYLDDMDFHFGLESLRQILKEARKKESMPFIENNKDYVLINQFSGFYLRPIYLFKNSFHIFDNEESIDELISGYTIMDGSEKIENFSFVDSKSNQLIQLSDVVVGLIGNLGSYLNTHNLEEIASNFCTLNRLQRENIELLLKVVVRSLNKNLGFLHIIDSDEEKSKIDLICFLINEIPA